MPSESYPQRLHIPDLQALCSVCEAACKYIPVKSPCSLQLLLQESSISEKIKELRTDLQMNESNELRYELDINNKLSGDIETETQKWYHNSINLFTQQKNPGNLAVPGYLTFEHMVSCDTNLYIFICQSVITR